MKNFTFLFFILIGVFIISSCNSKSDKKKVGFSVRSYKIDRCARERDFFKERADQLGFEVIVADATDNDQLQIKQCSDMLDQGVKVLVVFAYNGVTAASIIREAHERGAKVIAYESIIKDCELDYYVSASNRKAGQLMGKYVIDNYPKGNYVFIGGNKSDNNAILIKSGQHDIIDPEVKKGNIKILYDVYSDWTDEAGKFETNQMLSLLNVVPDIIIASSDIIAQGTIQALEVEGLAGKVPVTGLDAELSALQRIAKGTQSMTIFKSFKKEAYAAAELSFQLLNGDNPKLPITTFNGLVEVPSILIEPEVVTKNNIKEIIKKDNIYTEKDVYGN